MRKRCRRLSICLSLGGLIPKTITPTPADRKQTTPDGGNVVRACSTPSASITTDSTPSSTPISSICSSLGVSRHRQYCRQDGRRLPHDGRTPVRALTASPGLELNISCPNVTGGVGYGDRSQADGRSGASRPRVVRLASHRQADAQTSPMFPLIAQGAKEGGADAVSLVNTFQGMAVNWRKRKPISGERHRRTLGPGDQTAGIA